MFGNGAWIWGITSSIQEPDNRQQNVTILSAGFQFLHKTNHERDILLLLFGSWIYLNSTVIFPYFVIFIYMYVCILRERDIHVRRDVNWAEIGAGKPVPWR